MTANGVNLGGWFSETTYDVAAKLADITANANAEVHAKADVRNNANLTNNMQANGWANPIVMIVACLCTTAVAITAIGGASMVVGLFGLFFCGGLAMAFARQQPQDAQPRFAQPQDAQPRIAHDIKPQITNTGRFTELASKDEKKGSLVVTLYGGAEKKNPAKAGIYHLAPMTVNGKSYWVHTSGEFAIWCDPSGKWDIGDIADAGTTRSYIYTVDAVSVPQKASVWKYWFDGKWQSGQGLVSVSLQKSEDENYTLPKNGSLVVTLYGDAKKAQSIRAGIYHLAPSMVNGKSYWVQDSGRQVIWCDPSGWWSIGKVAGASTAACAIYTEDSVCVPQKASNWKYHDGNEWKSGQGLVSVSLQN